ncbi:MAG: WG repeat-containing protein [Saprospiraceae bacterium]|nr:WG repeat-containing protein [Saprospiraceae bacterium]
MKHYIITLLFLAGALPFVGQEVVFPFLVDDKYAIANHRGELLTEAIYDDVMFDNNKPIIAIKKNGLWGYLNYKGQTILEPVIRIDVRQNVIGFQGPSASAAGSVWSNNSSGRYPFAKSYLYYVKKWPNTYFFNPFVLDETAQPYLEASTINSNSKSRSNSGSYDRMGLYKVGTIDAKVNFLDSSGIPIFKEPVFDGFPVSSSVLAIENENGKFALFDRKQKAITPFLFDEVKTEDSGNFIQARKRGEGGYYALYSRYGYLIIDSLSEYPSMDHGMAIVHQKEENKVMLIDTSGKVLLSYINASLTFNQKRSDQFFYGKGGQYGLIDSLGNFLIQPVYSSLAQLDNDNYSFTQFNSGGVLDSNYHELWRLEGVHVTQTQSNRSDLYNIYKQGVYNGHATGLADQSGKVLFEPLYKFASYWNKCDLFYTQTDSTMAFYNTDFEMIIPPTKHFKSMDCEKGKIIFGETEPIEFDLNGNPWIYPKRDVRIQGADGKKFLSGPDNKPLTSVLYSTLQAYKNDSTGQQIFLGLKNDSDPFYEIINEQGTLLDLKEYGVPADHFIHPSECGLTIVVHKKAFTDRAGRVKKGVIDFNGQWVIPPDDQQIFIIQNELIYVSNPIKESITTYDRYGKKVSTKPYIFEKRSGNVQPPWLVEVTYGKNETEYLDFLKELWSFWRIASVNDPKTPYSVNFPEMVYGFIDLHGKEVVPMKYTKVSSFRYGYVCVVGKDTDEKAYSAILDLNGREMCKTNYDEISFFNKDSTSFKVALNGKYGIIDLNGLTKLEASFQAIERVPDVNDLWIAHDDQASYLIGKDFKPVKIGPPGIGVVNELPGDYYYVQINNSSPFQQEPLKVIFFDHSGKRLSQYENVNVLKNSYGKYIIPDGYALLVEKDSQLPFIFNFIDGKAFRK